MIIDTWDVVFICKMQTIKKKLYFGLIRWIEKNLDEMAKSWLRKIDFAVIQQLAVIMYELCVILKYSVSS